MDLKGRVIATNGPGSVSSYEIGKMLETAGLTIADVDLKVLPFSQYALAFENKAIDAALAILPFTMQLRDKGFAVPFVDADAVVEPRPITISAAMINTDWANAQRHRGAEFLSTPICAACATIVRPIMADRPARRSSTCWCKPAPNGGRKFCTNIRGRRATRMEKSRVESLLDMQAWYAKTNSSRSSFPPDRLVDPTFAAMPRRPNSGRSWWRTPPAPWRVAGDLAATITAND